MSAFDLLGAAVVLYMAAVSPILGRTRYRRLLRQIEAGIEGVRERFYVRSSFSKAIVTAAAGIWLAKAPWKLPFRFAWASFPAMINWLLLLTAAMGVSTLIFRHRGDGQLRFLLKTAGGIVPRTRRERYLFPIFCLVAGLSEEIICRWFMMSYLMATVNLGLWNSVAISSVLFGLAHFYQGIWGVLLTGILGAGFASIWLSTGTLLTAIVLHTLVDLRISFVLGPERIRRLEGTQGQRREPARR